MADFSWDKTVFSRELVKTHLNHQKKKVEEVFTTIEKTLYWRENEFWNFWEKNFWLLNIYRSEMRPTKCIKSFKISFRSFTNLKVRFSFNFNFLNSQNEAQKFNQLPDSIPNPQTNYLIIIFPKRPSKCNLHFQNWIFPSLPHQILN